VVVDAVAQAGVTDLIQSEESIEAIGPSVRHQEPVKRDGETRLAEALNRTRLTEYSGTGWYHNVPAGM
jgi:hypothetical protein